MYTVSKITLEKNDLIKKDAGPKVPVKNSKTKKCNQCDYAPSHAGQLRTHLRTHSGEKLNKCNQCNYAFFDASNLRKHLKTHSVEK